VVPREGSTALVRTNTRLEANGAKISMLVGVDLTLSIGECDPYLPQHLVGPSSPSPDP
jgi:hypothetical protein